MIYIKSDDELELMRKAGRIAALAREAAAECIKPGVTTHSIDSTVKRVIQSHGAIPSFLGYAGFPASACISVNDELIHGIPSGRVLKEGDVVKIDVGANYKGFHGDCAGTYGVGSISPEAQKLIDVTEQSFFEGMKMAVIGNRISDVSAAVQTYVESFGFGVVREYVGHGIGRALHESPEVPNYVSKMRGPRLEKGMTICIEPMVTQGSRQVKVLSDDWTVVTCDGTLTAHYENTIAILESGPIILTDPR
jgi:methionyl aminopeptidase